MADNRWAEPGGYSLKEAPIVRYKILDAFEHRVVIRYTQSAEDPINHRYYLSFSRSDQMFANAIVHQVQLACAYFYEPDDAKYVPLKGWDGARVTDGEVRDRIRRLNKGENERERDRVNRGRGTIRSYPLDELPWDQQRALIEQIDRIKDEWQFEILEEATAEEIHAQEVAASAAMVYPNPDEEFQIAILD